ncbi:MAG: cytidylate kinase [Acidithiobacillales bacterium SG8_45]|nr:MAG: cytidylate kinase [Acidithiobacillales bacterium SG8_45]
MIQTVSPDTSAPVLAIDGPSGSGKGTISQLIAVRHGWHYLDSGALYRLVALAAKKAGIGEDRVDELEAIARNLDVEFVLQPGAIATVILDGKEVGDLLRTEEIGELASRIAALPSIRAALLARQRQFQIAPGLVADGRDMGTTIFPAALLKIFLTASAEVRAERRYKQLMEKGFDVNLPRLLGEIRDRDARDSERSASPLKPADDAVVVDTSSMTIDQVVDHIDGLLQDRLGA